MFHTWYLKDILTIGKKNRFFPAASPVDAVTCHCVVELTAEEGEGPGFLPTLPFKCSDLGS